MRRYALRDDQWDRIKDLLPGRAGCRGHGEGRPPVRGGGAVPLPGGHSLARPAGTVRRLEEVHTRFGRWARTSVWERIFRHLAGEADDEYAMIDSTIVRAHRHSAGAVKKGWRRGDRAQQRRPEHQDPRPGRRARRPDRVRPLAGAGARPRGRRRAAAGLRGRADRRQGVRRRGAGARAARAGRQDRGHPARGEPQGPAPVRPRLVQGAAPDQSSLYDCTTLACKVRGSKAVGLKPTTVLDQPTSLLVLVLEVSAKRYFLP